MEDGSRDENSIEMKEIDVKPEPPLSRTQRIKKFLNSYEARIQIGSFAVIVVILMVLAIGAFYGVRNKTFVSPTRSIDYDNIDGIVINGSIITVDFKTQRVSFITTRLYLAQTSQMTIQWGIEAYGAWADQFNNLNCTDGVIQANGANYKYSNDDPVQAYFFSFTTTTPFDPDNSELSGTIAYPFDRYNATFVFTAFCQGAPITIYGSFIVESIQGVSFHYINQSLIYPAIEGETGNIATYSIGRSQASIAYVILLILFMWMITLLLVNLAIMSMVWSVVLPPQLVTVPAAVLFAFPSMRNSMPDPPVIGIIFPFSSARFYL